MVIWIVIQQLVLGFATLSLAIIFHEAGHRKAAWKQHREAKLVWTRKGPAVRYDATRLTREQEKHILLWGIGMGSTPLFLMSLLGHVYALETFLSLIVLYLLACKHDITRIHQLETKS